jgi:hypothetical protein
VTGQSTYRAVDGEGLVNVDGHKVIIAGSSTRSPVLVRLGRLLLEALDGVNVGLALGLGESGPVPANGGSRQRALGSSCPLSLSTLKSLESGKSLLVELEHDLGRVFVRTVDQVDKGGRRDGGQAQRQQQLAETHCGTVLVCKLMTCRYAQTPDLEVGERSVEGEGGREGGKKNV